MTGCCCLVQEEIERILTGCCCLVQEEIEKYRRENVTADSERHRELSQLEERLSETQEQAAWYQHKHQAAVKRVDQLKVHTHSQHQHHKHQAAVKHVAQGTHTLTDTHKDTDTYTYTYTLTHSFSSTKHQAAVKRVNQLKVHSHTQTQPLSLTHTQT